MKTTFEAEVVVMPKEEVADPQGQAIEAAVNRSDLGREKSIQLEDVRVGKVIRLRLQATDRASAEQAVDTLADQILTNPNIESYHCLLKESTRATV